MQIYDILYGLLRKWWVIALVGLFSVSLALFTSYSTTPVYRTSSRYIVSPGPALLAGDERDLVNSITALDRRSIIATYAEIMNSEHIFDQAGAILGLSPNDLKDYRLTAVVLPEAHALEIIVEGPDPNTIADLANTTGEQAIIRVHNLYQIYTMSLLDAASVPEKPISPNPTRDAGVALILGLLAGTGLAFASDYIGSINTSASVSKRKQRGNSLLLGLNSNFAKVRRSVLVTGAALFIGAIILSTRGYLGSRLLSSLNDSTSDEARAQIGDEANLTQETNLNVLEIEQPQAVPATASPMPTSPTFVGQRQSITPSITAVEIAAPTPLQPTPTRKTDPGKTLTPQVGQAETRQEKTTTNNLLPLSTSTPKSDVQKPSSARPATSTRTAIGTPDATPTKVSATVVRAPKSAFVINVQSNGTDHELNLVKSNGEFVKKLQTHGAAPAWSPNANQIAFFGEQGISKLGGVFEQGNGIYLIDPWNEQEPFRLLGIDHVNYLSWSPNGASLAMEVEPPGSARQTVVIDANTGQEVSRFYGEQPAWSPDSQSLVIKGCLPGCGLWLVAPGGNKIERLTFDGSDSFPDWSSDGHQLVFSSNNRDSDWEIYRLRMAGQAPLGEPERLTTRTGVDTTPVFNPDSQEIYVRTNANAFGSWQVTAITLDGSSERLVSEDVGHSDEWGLARPSVR